MRPASQLEGLRGFEAEEVWVVIPQGQRRPTRDGLVVSWSSRLELHDVHPLRSPRRTTIERSVVDMCATARSGTAAAAPVLAAVQQRLTVPHRLRAALARRGPCPRRAVIAEAIDDAEGGIQSLPERAFDRLIRRRGLPPPTRQRTVRRRDGRYYLDADWEEFDLSAEIHGLPHLQVLNWHADLDRHNELSIDGRRLLQFCSAAVRHQPRRVADQLERGLRRGGWRS